MNQTFPFLNYHYIVKNHEKVLKQIESLNQKLSIKYNKDYLNDLNRLWDNLTKLEMVKQNAKLVHHFIQTRLNITCTKEIEYSSFSEWYSDLASIHVGQSNGNTIGISRFLLKNLDKCIIVITNNTRDYLRGTECVYNNIRFIRPKDASKLRGLRPDLVILDNVSSDIVLTKVIPELNSQVMLSRRVVKVGDCN